MSGAKDSTTALVLLSGGLDSATCLAQAKMDCDKVEGFFVDYGQAYSKELDHARMIADHFKVKLRVRTVSKLEQDKDFFPFRNLIIFAMAGNYAESNGIKYLYHGANAEDIYPDNSRKFIIEFNLVCRSMKSDVSVMTPLRDMNKADIIRQAKALDVPISMTWSCYTNDAEPCGVCQACIRRHNGFQELRRRNLQT